MDHKRVIEELQAQARAAMREDKNRAEVFGVFIRSEGWKLYVGLLSHQIEALGAELIQPSIGIEGVLKAEFQKGMMHAFLVARDMPAVIVEAMKPTKEEEE